MVYDLDHNPATQPRMFGLEPDGVDCLKTFVGHGTWWITRFARPLLCSEQLQEHGFPVEDELLEQLQLRMPLDWYFLMEERIVNNLAVSSMAGNGWSIPCMGAFIVYVLRCWNQEPLISRSVNPCRRRATVVSPMRIRLMNAIMLKPEILLTSPVQSRSRGGAW